VGLSMGRKIILKVDEMGGESVDWPRVRSQRH
jgi:hypothetical protein